MGKLLNCNLEVYISVIVPIVFAIIVYIFKQIKHKRNLRDACTYDFIISFIIPFNIIYEFFFGIAKKNGSGSVDVAIVNLEKKEVEEVQVMLEENELDYKFVFFYDNISEILVKAFHKKDVGCIFEFVRRAEILAKAQQSILKDIKSGNKEKQMKNFIKNQNNGDIICVLDEILGMHNVIRSLPKKMKINKKLLELQNINFH